MRRSDQVTRRYFLQGLAGVLMIGPSFAQEPEQRVRLIKRLCNDFPEDPQKIPGAARINKRYVSGSNHLLLKIHQRSMGIYNAHEPIEKIKKIEKAIAQVQKDIKHILEYLIKHEPEGEAYFPRSHEGKRLVYCQRLGIRESLEWVMKNLYTEENQESLARQLKRYLNSREEIRMAIRCLTSANFKAQMVSLPQEYLLAFHFNDSPAAVVIIAPELPEGTTRALEQKDKQKWRYTMSSIEIIPKSLDEQISRLYSSRNM